eukprot:1157097-Pelagomonas_calceolata.AAC.11
MCRRKLTEVDVHRAAVNETIGTCHECLLKWPVLDCLVELTVHECLLKLTAHEYLTALCF